MSRIDRERASDSRMTFDEIRQTALQSDDISVPASWVQGRTVFGGVSAGLLADAVSSDVDATYRLRYLKVGFLKPLAPEQPFCIDVDTVSSGRTVIVRTATLRQGDVVCVSAQANLIARIDSNVVIEPFAPPSLRPPGAEGTLHMRGPLFPTFTQHIDFHATTSGLPFHGGDDPTLGGWMRFETPPERLTNAHLVCLIDVWPPVPVTHYDRIVPLSSVTWGIHFAAPIDDVAGDDYLGYLATANFFRDGYGSSAADIWSTDGRLLAKSYQTFVIYG